MSVVAECPVCGESIKANAQLCIHCKSDFTWKRFFPIGTTAVAILTALLAVGSSATPVIKKWLHPEAELAFTMIGESDSTAIDLLISNTGTAVGVVGYVTFFVPLPKKQSDLGPTWVGAIPDSGFAEIAPDATKRIKFKWDARQKNFPNEIYRDKFGEARSYLSSISGCGFNPTVVNSKGVVDDKTQYKFECIRVAQRLSRSSE
jgi:hypothetical protein